VTNIRSCRGDDVAYLPHALAGVVLSAAGMRNVAGTPLIYGGPRQAARARCGREMRRWCLVRRICAAETVIDASAEAIWAVVADVTRVGEWSGECRGCSWTGEPGAPVPGARFQGANRRSWLRWTRLNEIVAAAQSRQLVWRTIPSGPYPDSVEWQIDLAPENGSTRVRESFTVLAMPRLMEWLLWVTVPGHRDRTSDLESDLERLKHLVENSPVPRNRGPDIHG
jgi:hypothetical protein